MMLLSFFSPRIKPEIWFTELLWYDLHKQWVPSFLFLSLTVCSCHSLHSAPLLPNWTLPLTNCFENVHGRSGEIVAGSAQMLLGSWRHSLQSPLFRGWRNSFILGDKGGPRKVFLTGPWVSCGDEWASTGSWDSQKLNLSLQCGFDPLYWFLALELVLLVRKVTLLVASAQLHGCQ